MKIVLLLISVLTINFSFAQYSELSDQDLVLRMWKTYNYTQNNDDNIVKKWLSIFDKKNYPSYAKNEFLMSDKLDQTKQVIQQRLDNMQDPGIYCFYDSRSFGEYDFNLEQYKFKPFTNLTTEKHFVYTLLGNDKLFSTNLKIAGLDFVNGIPMSKVQAEQFLNNRVQKNIWGQTTNNRTLYLKIFYYNSIDDRFPANSKDAYYQYVKGTPILVQAFNDKNYVDFVCEWWSPTISAYYKQQLIDNNIPKSLYKSFNQNEEQYNEPNLNLSTPTYDRDGDGIVNGFDNCPDVPGMISAQGCPDRDGDGVPDDADKCPDVAGIASNKGCPELIEEVKKKSSFFENSEATKPSVDMLQRKAQNQQLDLPFVGRRGFETRPGVSGKGTPQRYIEIMNNGDVYFGFEQINQADNTITKEKYYAGKFTVYMKCFFKEWDNEITYYKITKHKIYEVDKDNKQLTGIECCSYDYSDLEDKCPCVGEFY